ncbi:D-xylose 1-dehydrogenase Gfo6 [Halostella salina]|uniref:D-xylose 1-dehydrogenase Gfo6 n=1 Tax=Halostella salina TaxID=1547897 RepID=UPI000EF84C92|nr:D-xylose 1-dehydrogenase Gfo6 [Halostella salina]
MDSGTYFGEFNRRDWRTASEGTVRIAVVGLGGFARNRALPAIRDSDFCEATVLVSGSPDKAASLADEFGTERTVSYDAFREGEAADRYDAAYVSTPPAFHDEYAVAAADLGKHVLCEKPLAATVADAERMVDACADAGVVLMTAYRLRTEPAIRRMREAIRDGAIGDPVQIHAGFSSRLLDNAGPESWRLDPDVAGGGALMDLGVYPLNTSRFLLDADPVAVSAETQSSGAPFDRVEEHAALLLTFPDGVTASCTASFGGHHDSRLQVLGTEGQVIVHSPFGGHATEGVVLARGEARTSYAGRPVDEVCEEFDYFADCVLDGGTCESDGEEGYADLRIIDRAYEAAEIGERVAVHASR